MSYHVGIAGATGAVGRAMLEVLERRSFPLKSLRLFASERSAGKAMRFIDRDVEVELLTEECFHGLDIVLFSAGSGIARKLAPAAAAAGALVVDNSSAFRMDPDVPLVVPEVNPEAGRGRRAGIIANPNCTTIITLLAVAPIHRAACVERFTAATYQSASGAGASGMGELDEQVRAYAEAKPLEASVFRKQLAFNVIPEVDAFEDNGYTREELKMLNESRKILGDDAMRISTTCVRVPTLRAHAVAVHLETRDALEPDAARALLREAPGVIVEDDPADHRYPTPFEIAGRDEVAVGRIRKDLSHPRGLAMWVVGDQLLKGAALNAVQCAELAFGIEGPGGGGAA